MKPFLARGVVATAWLLVASVPAHAFAQNVPAGPARYATLPAVAPNGKLVAYLRERDSVSCDLRVVGLDGSNDRLVWRAPFDGGLPGWIDGGRRVTLLRTVRDTATVWSLPLAGGEPRVELKRPAKSLSVSRDGRRVAYLLGDWRKGVLMVANADGSRARPLSDSTSGWFNIAWSPGDRLLAASHLAAGGEMQVWLVDPKAGSSRPLTSFDADRGRPQWPTWSPDGKRVAVQAGHYDRAHPESNTADLWIVDVATGDATRVGSRSGTWMDETPAWTPDGRRLVFQSSRTGRFEIWSMNADGSDARSLTP